jgi:hypothetical protein
MPFSSVLEEIDAEIEKLKQARALLASDTKRGPGRPRTISPDAEPPRTKKKRNLTPEGRKRIIEGVKRRWALQKKASSK